MKKIYDISVESKNDIQIVLTHMLYWMLVIMTGGLMLCIRPYEEFVNQELSVYGNEHLISTALHDSFRGVDFTMEVNKISRATIINKVEMLKDKRKPFKIHIKEYENHKTIKIIHKKRSYILLFKTLYYT